MNLFLYHYHSPAFRPFLPPFERAGPSAIALVEPFPLWPKYIAVGLDGYCVLII